MNLNPQILSPSLWKFKPNLENITKIFQPPPTGFLKLNFDGASKGNPGQAGIGDIFRNFQASAIRICSFPIGFATNNEAELMAIKQGLLIATREKNQRLIVEGDSAMTIGIIQKPQQGSNWEKISKSWRTTRLIEEIGNLI